MSEEGTDTNTTMALLGTVPVKATTENGPIKPGDLLTTSSKPGYAMVCNDTSRCADSLIGKALESLKEGEDDLDNANIEVAVVTVDDGYQRIEPDELEDRGLGV